MVDKDIIAGLTGARINTPTKGRPASRIPSMSSSASNDSIYETRDPFGDRSRRTRAKQRTWDPHPLRPILMSIPPIPSCPPFFVPITSRDRRIAPAQVPQTGRDCTNSLNGSSNPFSFARSAIVVDSPPGMISASHVSSSSGVRTRMEVMEALVFGFDVEHAGSRCKIAWCSAKAPCKAAAHMVERGVIG